MSTIDRTGKHRAASRGLLVGLGSLIDVAGLQTYEAMRDLMPDPPKRTVRDTFREVAELMTPTR